MEQFNQQEQQMRVDMTQTTPILCSCGNNTFQEVVMLRKWSRFASGLPTDQTIPIGVMTCVKCGLINEDILPPQLKVLLEQDNV